MMQTGSYYVDFEITDRIYQATGDKKRGTAWIPLVIGENYFNHETLGRLTIRKTGEVLANWKTEAGALDPWMTDGSRGQWLFTKPARWPVQKYTITAAEDIYTQDRQTDNYGQRTLWYAKGDVIAVVTTGERQRRYFRFALLPAPRQPTIFCPLSMMARLARSGGDPCRWALPYRGNQAAVWLCWYG